MRDKRETINISKMIMSVSSYEQASVHVIGDASGCCTCHESSSGSCESPVSVTHPPQSRRNISLCFQE